MTCTLYTAGLTAQCSSSAPPQLHVNSVHVCVCMRAFVCACDAG